MPVRRHLKSSLVGRRQYIFPALFVSALGTLSWISRQTKGCLNLGVRLARTHAQQRHEQLLPPLPCCFADDQRTCRGPDLSERNYEHMQGVEKGDPVSRQVGFAPSAMLGGQLSASGEAQPDALPCPAPEGSVPSAPAQQGQPGSRQGGTGHHHLVWHKSAEGVFNPPPEAEAGPGASNSAEDSSQSTVLSKLKKWVSGGACEERADVSGGRAGGWVGGLTVQLERVLSGRPCYHAACACQQSGAAPGASV
jgi:hypothetical protein